MRKPPSRKPRRKRAFVAHRKEERLRRLELEAESKAHAEAIVEEGGPFTKDEDIYTRARTEHIEEIK